MSHDLLWQAAIPGEAVKVWQPSCAPLFRTGLGKRRWGGRAGAAGAMNSLMGWFEQHVHAVLTEENTDLPPLTPAAVLWGLGALAAWKAGIVGLDDVVIPT